MKQPDASTLDDIDWRAGGMRVRTTGRQRARVPVPPEVGAAVAAYMKALEAANVQSNIGPFAEFIATRVKAAIDQADKKTP
jgi:integrase